MNLIATSADYFMWLTAPSILAALAGGSVAVAVTFKSRLRQAADSAVKPTQADVFLSAVCAFVIGVLVSVFVTDFICEHYSVTSSGAIKAIAFGMAVFGVPLIDAATTVVEQLLREPMAKLRHMLSKPMDAIAKPSAKLTKARDKRDATRE